MLNKFKTALLIMYFSCLVLFPNQMFCIPNKIIAKHPNPTSKEAAALVHQALEAMGGETKIRALSTVKMEGIGHTFAVEQSERPEDPFIVTYQQIKEIRDLTKQRLRQTMETKQAQSTNWRSVDMIVADSFVVFESGGKSFPGYILQVEDTKKQFALSPERILLTALEAQDLRMEKDALMQGVPHHVLKFTWEKVPVTIYLNIYTNLPTAVETLSASPYENFWSIWGDFTTRTYYSFWTLDPSGIRYPFQWDIEKCGYQFQSFSVSSIKLNEPLNDDQFVISEDNKKAFKAIPLLKVDDIPLGFPSRPPTEIAPGIVKVAGRWDIAYVVQPDGIIIIESPISSGYSVKVLDEAKKRFPNQKIKALITTSDAFPHFGGVREYAAQNIPIYILDLNRPIVEKVLSTPHKFYPDNLEQNPRKPNLKTISGKTILGNGANRLEIYPIRSESGERMMMIYFPEYKLLYSSDLIIQGRGGNSFFSSQYLTEVMDAVKRENLDVENVFGMHLGKIPWSNVTKFVSEQTIQK